MHRAPIVDEGYLALLEDTEVMSTGKVKDLKNIKSEEEKVQF